MIFGLLTGQALKLVQNNLNVKGGEQLLLETKVHTGLLCGLEGLLSEGEGDFVRLAIWLCTGL